jgi:uncharacterized membrane protein (DUF485 family)
MRLKDLKPKTRYELFKLILNITILIVFLVFIFLHSYSFREGFYRALELCKEKCLCPYGILP